MLLAHGGLLLVRAHRPFDASIQEPKPGSQITQVDPLIID